MSTLISPPPPDGIAAVPSEPDALLQPLQQEIDSLRKEISMLRSRDQIIKLYMSRIDEEMRLASRLQRDFLPREIPQIGRVRFHTLFRPAGYVSGDLYDVMRLDEKHVGFYVADAVGHGMPAALLTMFMKRALETKQINAAGYRLLRPSETMGKLNDSLIQQQLSQATFATAIYGRINTDTLEMTFARAGHPHPLLLRADGELESLHADGGLLGIFEAEQYDDGAVVLESGDRLFIFSDGIEVCFSDDGGMDTRRWREHLVNRRDLSTEQLLADLSIHIDREAGSLDPKDDLTIIIAEAL